MKRGLQLHWLRPRRLYIWRLPRKEHAQTKPSLLSSPLLSRLPPLRTTNDAEARNNSKTMSLGHSRGSQSSQVHKQGLLTSVILAEHGSMMYRLRSHIPTSLSHRIATESPHRRTLVGGMPPGHRDHGKDLALPLDQPLNEGDLQQ